MDVPDFTKRVLTEVLEVRDAEILRTGTPPAELIVRFSTRAYYRYLTNPKPPGCDHTQVGPAKISPFRLKWPPDGLGSKDDFLVSTRKERDL